jgi:hypothetical protein
MPQGQCQRRTRRRDQVFASAHSTSEIDSKSKMAAA